jgi:hypothetical protein
VPPAGSRFPNGDAKIFQDQPRTSCVGLHRTPGGFHQTSYDRSSARYLPSVGHVTRLVCTTDTSYGNHFLPSIVLLCETCSGGPNFIIPRPPTECRCDLRCRHERFGPMQVPSPGTVRFCRYLTRRGSHSGRGGHCPRSSSGILL